MAAAIVCVGFSHAQVLLTVQWNPSTNLLTFTATGNPPIVDATIDAYGDGITLNHFFGANWDRDSLDNHSTVSSSLSDHAGNHFLNTLWVDLHQASGGYRNLGIYLSPSNPHVLNFSTASAAFSGSATFDLGNVTGTYWGDPLTFNEFFAAWGPAIGATGDLLAGYSGTPGVVIGSWQMTAVPEPSTYAFLAGLVTLCFVAWRRRTAAPAGI